MQWHNTVEDICADQADFCTKLKNFFLTQLDWIYSQIDKHPSDEYWHQVSAEERKDAVEHISFLSQINLLLVQLNGLIDGNQNKTRGPRKELDDPLGFL